MKTIAIITPVLLGFLSCDPDPGVKKYACEHLVKTRQIIDYESASKEWCYGIIEAQVCHTKPEIPKRTPADRNRIVEVYRSKVLQQMNDGSTTDAFRSADDAYPCGQSADALTLCADPSVDIDRPSHYVAFETAEALPLDDSTNLYQIGFVFDSDGDQTNNYTPSTEFINDFFENTDRWYVANYDPGTGWTMAVSDTTSGSIQPIASEARIIFVDATVALLVPIDEMPSADPAFRVTTFRHTGDYGINPPYDWDGAVSPPQHEPLFSD